MESSIKFVFKQKFIARIFYNDRNGEIAKADEARHVMKSDDGCVRTHCPRKTSRSTQHPSGFPASVGDRDEISGLTRLFHPGFTDSIVDCSEIVGLYQFVVA